MNQAVLGMLFSVLLFIGILVMIQAGQYFRRRHSVNDNISKSSALIAIESALYGLMGLILAFSFSGAGSRLDARRKLIVDEANCIGTAYLRLELLEPQRRKELQEMFRQYTDARLRVYRMLPDVAKAKAEVPSAVTLQRKIWTRAVSGCQQTGTPQTSILLLPALNSMFDIANSRNMATMMHQPVLIYLLMSVIVLICSLLAGFSMGDSSERNRIYIFSFALMLATTTYVIVDLDYPRLGLIHVRDFDKSIVDIRNNMDVSN
jgi:hypothetical protein